MRNQEMSLYGVGGDREREGGERGRERKIEREGDREKKRKREIKEEAEMKLNEEWRER